MVVDQGGDALAHAVERTRHGAHLFGLALAKRRRGAVQAEIFSRSGTDGSSGDSSAADLLQQFLRSLQSSLSSSSSSYNSTGTSGASSNGNSISALLIDYQS